MADTGIQLTTVECLEGCGLITSNNNSVIAAGEASFHASLKGHMVITQGSYGVTVYDREGMNVRSFSPTEWENRGPKVETLAHQHIRVECR